MLQEEFRAIGAVKCPLRLLEAGVINGTSRVMRGEQDAVHKPLPLDNSARGCESPDALLFEFLGSQGLKMTVEMVGGPLNGRFHEIAAHRAVPSSIGFRRGKLLHWYAVEVHNLIAIYTHSDTEVQPQRHVKAEHHAMMNELGWGVCSACHRHVPPNLIGNGEGVCKMCLKK